MQRKYLFSIIIIVIISMALLASQLLSTGDDDKSLREINQLLEDGQVMKVQVDGTRAYALSTGNSPLGLVIIDIDDPQNPQILGSFLSGWPLEFVVVNDLAYVVGAEGLEILDISDPTAIVEIGQYTTGDLVRDLAVQGNIVYLAGNNNGLMVIDVSNPELPVLEAQITLAGETIKVELSGETCFISRISQSFSGIEVYDVSDPSAPQYIDDFHRNSAIFFDFYASGNYLYASDHSDAGELYILDIANPSSITLVTTYSTGDYPQGVVVDDNIAYVTDVSDGLLLLDVSDPSSPTLLDTHFDGGSGQDVAVQGEYIYLADRTDGLEILTYS